MSRARQFRNVKEFPRRRGCKLSDHYRSLVRRAGDGRKRAGAGVDGETLDGGCASAATALAVCHINETGVLSVGGGGAPEQEPESQKRKEHLPLHNCFSLDSS